MAKKSSKSKEKLNKPKEKVKKNKKIKEAKSEPIDINKVRAAFYAKQLETVEKDLQLVSNSVIEPERLSSGVLTVDYIFGGGFIGLVSIAGEEGTAKTSICYHTLAIAKAKLDLPFVGFYDAEGAISPKYTENIWKPFGLDLKHLLSKKGREDGFYYYRDQVIERMFDYLKKALKMMPDKNWVSDANSWCYFFPKRDEYFKKLMEVMEMKPSKALSGGAHYVVPTENSKPEGLFSVDSFASLLTREEEDKEDTGTTRSAMEAAAFAKHLKRVKVDSLEKKIVILGTNHLGSHVRTQYGGPDEQQYEKMGNSLKYFSDQRARAYNRASSSASKYGKFDYDKDNSKFGIEKSVEGSGSDRYAYKEIKNVKNKFGNPGLKAPFRVWVSDHSGKPRGIDPVFDVYMFLKITGQLGTTKSGKKGKNLVFKLKPSFGKKRAEALNASEPFSFLTLKTLVIGEYTNDNSLIRKAVSELGISIKPKLRETLFAQLKNDDLLYSSSKEVKEEDDEDVDYEEI